MKAIQIQGSILEPIGTITSTARSLVSKVCLGIDDMQLLGNKALVLRAEIYPKKLPKLYEVLASIGVKLDKGNLPTVESLQEDLEYPLSIQIVSFSDDTESRILVPKVPG